MLTVVIEDVVILETTCTAAILEDLTVAADADAD